MAKTRSKRRTARAGKTKPAAAGKKAPQKARKKSRDPLDDINFEELEPTIGGHRLYVLGFDRYIQHDGSKTVPKELKHVIHTRKGEWPPYMPLPRGPVVFRLGGDFGNGRRVRWSGNDRLPDQVLRYVRENGTLPRYSEEEEDEGEEQE